MVPGPGVVDGYLGQENGVQVDGEALLGGYLAQPVQAGPGIGGNHHEAFMPLDGRCDVGITFLNLRQFIPRR